MTFNDDLAALTSPGRQGSDTKKSDIPDGWRPYMELGNDGGVFVSLPRTAGDLPDAVDLFADFDLDPNQWRVTGVRRSRWQRWDGEWLESARVAIVPASLVGAVDNSDLEQLVAGIAKWRPRTTAKPHTGTLSAVYAIGDTQYGKDAGDGTEGTIARVMSGLSGSLSRHKELTKLGRPIGSVILPQLGDAIEGCVSQNGKVLGRSDIQAQTSQVRIGRRILMEWIKAFAPLVEEIIVPVVPGNHDETTRQTITDPTDNWQIDIVSAVQDACAENPALAHVQFRYPERDNSTLAIDLNGQILGMAHGHQIRGGAAKWLQAQALGNTPVGNADVLLTAHFHHFIAQQIGPRLHIQIPASDGGSAWFRNTNGLDSPTGIVSFVMGDGYDPRRDLCVLEGETR